VNELMNKIFCAKLSAANARSRFCESNNLEASFSQQWAS
jgi:hypothetical protein